MNGIQHMALSAFMAIAFMCSMTTLGGSWAMSTGGLQQTDEIADGVDDPCKSQCEEMCRDDPIHCEYISDMVPASCVDVSESCHMSCGEVCNCADRCLGECEVGETGCGHGCLGTCYTAMRGELMEDGDEDEDEDEGESDGGEYAESTPMVPPDQYHAVTETTTNTYETTPSTK